MNDAKAVTYLVRKHWVDQPEVFLIFGHNLLQPVVELYRKQSQDWLDLSEVVL